ncbi:hypothetical protein SUGI_0186670 [Cryptomeria japonica]|uniref:flavonol synthase 1 n=1 Tax=Cryptomeria japonica TaxID=3369 RepID=UPI002408C7C3|nr:flavonol synthase 1 [Cryptomeria japonica]GLJ12209.1 hypothetical protein SUGI_0186670 [Cryptomeria japonica]
MAAVRVQSIAGSGLTSIPSEFIRPVHERPTIDNTNAQIPLIDLADLDAPGDRGEENRSQIGSAAREWGIFQVVNHGISEELIQRLQSVGKEFFDLPQEEKESYANDSLAGVMEGYGTRLARNLNGNREWIDYFFHMLWPPSIRNLHVWPKHPSSYIEVNDEYGRALFQVLNKLLSVLSIYLGLKEGGLKEVLGGEDLEMEMKVNYYPPCPQPELALGVEAHTDMSAMTLLVSNQVPGLQVHKDGHWVTVDYVPNAIIVHIGDQLEILSNGKYKSVLHRSMVNKDKVRMSWAVFCTPPNNKVIGPMKELTNEENPSLFNAKTYEEFKYRKINKLEQ